MPTTYESTLERAAAERARAEQLLDSLLEARAESVARLAESGQPDLLKSVTGRSSLDDAIERTERLLLQLGRAMDGIEKPVPGITVLVGSNGVHA